MTMFRSQTDEMLAAKYDPKPYVWYEGLRYSADMKMPPDAWFAPRSKFIPSREPNRSHSPIDWFTVGRYPHCSCGFDPHDNGKLTRHWADNGVRWVDVHGTLTAFVVRPPVNPILAWMRSATRQPWSKPARFILQEWPSTVGAAVAARIIEHPTDEQIDHARKVLTRLAALA